MKSIASISKKFFRAADRDRVALLLLFVFSAAIFAPAAYLGIPENYDFGQHLRFARTWHDTLSSGDLIPSWAGADNAGLGSAGIRFYPPVTHFVLAAVQFITRSWYDSVWVTMLIWMWIGAAGVFRLAREWSSRWTAFASAILYAVVPYHLLQVFQAFLLAEFTAAAILPFCFLYAYRLVTKGGINNSLLFVASYSMLVLSHIPTTIIGTLSLAIFVVGFLSIDNLVRTIVRFALALAISLAATAFYWVRMVSELSWVKHNTPEYYASGAYDYSIYFFPMLLSAGEVYLPRFLWLFDLCIVVTYALFIPALIVVVNRRFNAPRPLLALTAVGGFAFFMMSMASVPIWDNISVIQKLQFPYRWLSPASLMASLLFPMGVAALAERRKVITRPFAYSLTSIIMLLVVLNVSQIIVPSAPVPREDIMRAISKLDKEPSCECWWPVWATRDSMIDVEPITAGDREISIVRWESTAREFAVSAGTADRVRVGTFFYPHWRATVNGSPAEVSADSRGLIEMPIPAGGAEITLEFREPTFVIASRYASGLTMVMVLALLIFTSIRSKKVKAAPEIF